MLLNGPDNPRKLPFRISGSAPSWFTGPTLVFIQKGMSIGSAVFVWVPIAMLYNALSMGKKNPKTASVSLGFRHTAIGNMHKN